MRVREQGTVTTPNSLALYDVNDYISINTSRHTKTSMKSLLDRFTKAPYGFVEADVQWLVAKLFKDGDIAFYVNSEPVSLLSKSVDEIVRFITRKEFNERLMTEKRVRASEKQKKAVREVMKELFGASSPSDEDDAVMGSFMRYAQRLKNELEKLEIYYKTKPLYPGKNVVQNGMKMINSILQLRTTMEFFAAVDRERDNLLDYAEDYELVRKFFSGEQIGIFDRAIQLMAIYDDSHTFIVDEKIESTVAEIKGIMRKSSPYGEIYRLPGLLDELNEAHNELLNELEKPVIASIDEAWARVAAELEGKLCKERIQQSCSDRFRELYDKTDRCNNVATLQNIKVEADALKVRCLNEISAMESRMQAQKAAEEEAKHPQKQDAPAAGKGGVSDKMINTADRLGEKPIPYGKTSAKVKTQRSVSIKSVNTETTWQLETEEDVKRYVSELERKLIGMLEKDTILHIEF